MNFIKSAWQGKEKLWKVFWFGTIALIAVILICAAVLNGGGLVVALIHTFLVGASFIWYIIAIWRSAFNADWRGWGYIARAYVVMVPGLIVFGMVIGGLGRGNELIKYAGCKKALTEQATAQGLDPEQYLTDHKAELDKCRPNRTTPAD